MDRDSAVVFIHLESVTHRLFSFDSRIVQLLRNFHLRGLCLFRFSLFFRVKRARHDGMTVMNSVRQFRIVIHHPPWLLLGNFTANDTG